MVRPHEHLARFRHRSTKIDRRRHRRRHHLRPRRPHLPHVHALVPGAVPGRHAAHALGHVRGDDPRARREGLPGGLEEGGEGLNVGGGQRGRVGDARRDRLRVPELAGEGDGLVAAGDGVGGDEARERGGADGRRGGDVRGLAALGGGVADGRVGLVDERVGRDGRRVRGCCCRAAARAGGVARGRGDPASAGAGTCGGRVEVRFVPRHAEGLGDEAQRAQRHLRDVRLDDLALRRDGDGLGAGGGRDERVGCRGSGGGGGCERDELLALVGAGLRLRAVRVREVRVVVAGCGCGGHRGEEGGEGEEGEEHGFEVEIEVGVGLGGHGFRDWRMND